MQMVAVERRFLRKLEFLNARGISVAEFSSLSPWWDVAMALATTINGDPMWGDRMVIDQGAYDVPEDTWDQIVRAVQLVRFLERAKVAPWDTSVPDGEVRLHPLVVCDVVTNLIEELR